MPVHYDPNAGYHPNRKGLASSAKNIEAEKNGGVNQRYFNSRFMRDNYHSKSFFRKVCKQVGDLKNKEIEQMLTILENERVHKEGELYHFRGEDMYEVLVSNPICKKVCEKQRYTNWDDIIGRFG